MNAVLCKHGPQHKLDMVDEEVVEHLYSATDRRQDIASWFEDGRRSGKW